MVHEYLPKRLAAQRVCSSAELVHTGEEDREPALITPPLLSFIYPLQALITGCGLGASKQPWVTWGWSG